MNSKIQRFWSIYKLHRFVRFNVWVHTGLIDCFRFLVMNCMNDWFIDWLIDLLNDRLIGCILQATARARVSWSRRCCCRCRRSRASGSWCRSCTSTGSGTCSGICRTFGRFQVWFFAGLWICIILMRIRILGSAIRIGKNGSRSGSSFWCTISLSLISLLRFPRL